MDQGETNAIGFPTVIGVIACLQQRGQGSWEFRVKSLSSVILSSRDLPSKNRLIGVFSLSVVDRNYFRLLGAPSGLIL